MNFTQVLASIRYAAAGLLRRSGRDGRRRFWPWAVFVFLLSQAIATIVMIPTMVGGFVRIVETIEAQNLVVGSAAEQAVAERAAAQMAAELGALWIPLAAIDAIAAALLAAAVIRRLHDRDLTACWGLLPLPFMAVSLVLTPQAFAFAAGVPGEPDLGLQFGALSTALFWASLLWLGFLLAGRGSEGANRFGPAPREAP